MNQKSAKSGKRAKITKTIRSLICYQILTDKWKMGGEELLILLGMCHHCHVESYQILCVNEYKTMYRCTTCCRSYHMLRTMCLFMFESKYECMQIHL